MKNERVEDMLESVEKTDNKDIEKSDDSNNAVEENQPIETERTGSIGKKILVGVIIFVVVVLAAVYFGGFFYYRTRFFPNTVINGIKCDNMEVSVVVPLVDAQIEEYLLTVTGRDYATGEAGAVLGTIEAKDIGLAYVDTEAAIQTLLETQNPYFWLSPYVFKTHQGHSVVQGVAFDEAGLRETVGGWEACQRDKMLLPRDAYISEYSEEQKGYSVIPETSGTELDIEKVLEHISVAIYSYEQAIDLEELQCYKEAEVKSTDAGLNDIVNTVNRWLSTEVIYDWNGNQVVVDAELIKDWTSIVGGAPLLDEDAVTSFVWKQSRQYDTYAKDKKFITALGIELTLNSASYGWKTDAETEAQELVQLIYQGTTVEKEPAYIRRGVKKGANDIGNSYIEADLTHQHLYVYQDGNVVFETDFVSGRMNSTPDCVTPQGIFGLTYKTTNAVLRGADYETPVSYWMPFFGNYGMHDATWRADFGGIIYQEFGSHGCINLPLESAAVIYNYVYTGSPIICYYYEVDPLDTPTTLEGVTAEELMQQQEPTLSGAVQ